jgi:DNA-binding transcriptional LysR family regulator
MNLTNLRTFVAVVDHGSFSGAARALGVSQPAVTMQVQALESSVGTPLLDRHYRRIDLTEAGQVLIEHARAVLDQIEVASEEIASLSGTVSGRLVIAASTTPGDYVIPRLLGAFLAANPQVQVAISVRDSAQVAAAVDCGEAHLGVTGAQVKESRSTFEPLGCDELVLISGPDNPLAKKRKVALGSLDGERWVLRESGSGTRQVAEGVLAAAGLDPANLGVVVELGTGEAIVSAIEGGIGISIVSREVAAKSIALGAVVEVDAVGMPVSRPFFLVSPAGAKTRAAEAFIAYLREAIDG